MIAYIKLPLLFLNLYDTAFMKLSAHLRYLPEEIVAFSFFSQHSYVTKSMALRLLSMLPPDEFCRGILVFKRVMD